MAASATRDIVFRLKAQVDPGAKAALDKFAKDVLATQGAIATAIEKTGQRHAKDVEKYNGHSLSYWAKYSREIDSELKKQERAVERAAQQQVRATERAAAQQLKAIERGAREAEKFAQQSAKAQARAAEMAAREQERAVGRAVSARAGMSAGFDKASEGLIKLGRGLAMSGMIGEENLQKITDGLLKIQAVSDAIRGGKDLIGGVSAMSAAGKAAGAAGAGGAMAGAASLAVPALAAVAALGSLALAAKVASEALNGTANREGSVSDTIGGAESSIIGWLDSVTGGTKLNDYAAKAIDFTDITAPLRDAILGADKTKPANEAAKGLAEGMLATARAARQSKEALEANAKAAVKAAADREAIDKATAGNIRNAAVERANQQSARDVANRFAVENAGAGLTDNDKAALLNEQARIDAVKEIQASEAAMAEAKKGGLQSEKTAAEIHHSALERSLALHYEQLGIVKQEKAERVAGLRESLAIQEQAAAKAMAHAKELHNATRSDQQRFADLDVEQKKQLIEVRDKLDKGANLTKEEADLAGGFNEFRDRVNVNRANQGAAQDVFGLFRPGQERAARAAEQAGVQQDKKIEISSTINVVFENKVDEETVIRALQPIVQETMKSQKQMEEIVKREVAAGVRGGVSARSAVIR